MDNEKILLDYIDAHKDDLFKLLSDMLKLDTQNYGTHGDEIVGQEFLMKYCAENGYEADLYNPSEVPGFLSHPEYLENRSADKRPNVSIRFKGNNDKKRIMLAAHMDTEVIGDESRWSVPALGGVIKDGRIWGRGAGDDKGGIAAALFAARAFAECGIVPENEVIVTSYSDEEGGGGNGALAACLKYPSDIYVNLDAAHLEVWPWSIGGGCFEAIVRKNHLTATSEDTFDALNVVAKHLKKFGKKLYKELGANKVYRNTVEQEQAYRLEDVKIDGSTHEIGTLLFDIYTLSDYDTIKSELDLITEKVSKEIKKYDMTFDGFIPTTRYFHPLMPKEIPEEAMAFAKALSEVTGQPAKFAGGCMSDLSLMGNFGGGVAFNSGIFRKFHEYGGAHQIDEYVECDELLSLTKALALFVVRTK